MPAKITNHLRQYTADAFATNIAEFTIPSWKMGKHYVPGDKVTSLGAVYICASTGNSGAIDPKHTSGIDTDGNLNWIFSENLGSKIFESNMYVAYGQFDPWVGSPPEPIIDDTTTGTTLNNIVALRAVTSFDTRVAVSRNDWTAGTIYDHYNRSGNYTRPFFVMHDGRIYKCLDNNNEAPSTYPPNETTFSSFKTADGYVWKYLSPLFDTDVIKFATADFYPVILAKTSAQDPTQFSIRGEATINGISRFQVLGTVGDFNGLTDVKIESSSGSGGKAAATIVDKKITQVYMVDPGSDYTSAMAYVTLKNSAGSGAKANATIVDGAITEFIMTSSGDLYDAATVVIIGTRADGSRFSDTSIPNIVAKKIVGIAPPVVDPTKVYASAQVHILPGTAGAVAEAELGPYYGHGHNIISELDAKHVIVSIDVKNADEYFLTGAGNAIHQVMLLTDVYTPAGDYCTHMNLLGPAHPDYNVLNSLKRFAGGTIMCVNNVDPIIRSSAQAERVKMVMTF